jgi:hypothetical protein
MRPLQGCVALFVPQVNTHMSCMTSGEVRSDAQGKTRPHVTCLCMQQSLCSSRVNTAVEHAAVLTAGSVLRNPNTKHVCRQMPVSNHPPLPGLEAPTINTNWFGTWYDELRRPIAPPLVSTCVARIPGQHLGHGKTPVPGPNADNNTDNICLDAAVGSQPHMTRHKCAPCMVKKTKRMTSKA